MKQPFDSYDTRIASLLQIYKSYLLCTQLIVMFYFDLI